MIRAAVPEDLPTVEGIVQAAYTPWVEIIGMPPLPLEADYPALISAGHVWILDSLDGLIVLIPETETLLVDNVAVHPSAQGRGLGHRLLAFAEAHARSLGLARLRLYTNEKMLSNIALYTRLGYREVARETLNRRHAVHMHKPLPPT